MLDIREILKSKPHNPHHLNRYIKFIEYCKNQEFSGYTENHHICPKAKDLFPEHKDESWNYVTLSARHHTLAHIMLWKVYGGSQTTALHYFLNIQNLDMHYGKRVIPKAYISRYASKIREENNKARKGTAVYKNTNGDRFLLHRDDPLIQSQDLVGILSGHKMSEESKEKMRGDRVTTLFYKGSLETKSIKTNDPEYQKNLDSHLSLGWKLERSEENKIEIKTKRYESVSKAMSGVTAMYYPSGTYYGKIPKDSPIVKELGLIHIRSEKQSETALRAAKSAREANIGSTIWNNGIEERKFHSKPENSQWKEGRLPRSAEHKENQKSAVSAKIGGSKTYNDGVRNYRIQPGDYINPEWKTGMAPQKSRKRKI